ncbi:efflux RND transporter periplasmic adaptor subunit [Alloacidobacterium dinghuense]|uniref:Efflux RND transporter periplasmic adaptor subunit n=1 Tax=Alloacidobacterium dinghuense TaxID=2763107 RepID=A0A7G8BK77_9BACT|nr:efflux RND transporter periplasmic adaptor subunit [Alloacidobacterium dinghuense]QNI32947.1 efflux RND transporter periplasmic adaptor subunit [Alloacidobacterium dinghuense]
MRELIDKKRALRYERELLIGILLALILASAGCSKKETAPEVQVDVQAAHPTQGPISAHVTADAVLAPLAQAAIAPKISAPVTKFYVQRGSHVKEGQLLATLENRDLTAAALDNEGSFTAATAAYDASTKAQVPEDYQKAELDFTQAKANLELNQSIVNSRKQLFAEGAIPGRDLDTAVAALVQAQAAYDTTKKHLESMTTVSHEAALKEAQGQLASAKGKYMGAEAQVSYSEIHSPINGVVTDRPLFAGETATTGAPLLTVMDTSALVAKIHISQLLAQRLQIGDSASITVPGFDEPVPAKVSLISPALDPGSTTVEVWLRIDNKDGKIKVGTPVHAAIASKAIQNALKVPTAAILTAQDGSKSVMIVGADGAAHKKTVDVGVQDAGEVQITTGLSTNDLVINEGAYGLDDGTKVKLATASGEDKPSAAKSGDDQ